MPIPGIFVDDPNGANRDQLLRITRAVYVMQSQTVLRLFRFGLIGGGGSLDQSPTDKNSAWNRPKQCARTWRRTDGSPEVLQFVLLCSIPHATKREIKQLESVLRRTFLENNPQLFQRFQNGLFEVHRFRDNGRDLAGNLDAFVVRRDEDIPLVVATAEQALRPHLSLL